MEKTMSFWFRLTYSLLLITYSTCIYTPQSTTFYLRHYFAKCLQYDTTTQVFVFASICREKYRWSSGTKIIHDPTNQCLNVNSTADGSFLGLSSKCNSTSNLFQYDQVNRVIIHLLSGKCLHPQNGSANPSSNSAVVIKSGCNLNTNKYYFRPNAYYIIRHFGGYCWVYDSSTNYIKLRNPNVCDRFYYGNDHHLRHVNTGKCVIYDDTPLHHLKLSEDCTSPKAVFKQKAFSNIELTSGYCVTTLHRLVQPPLDDYLVGNEGCSSDNRFRFYFYDERDTLKVKILSESCDDVSGVCVNARGHITINGHQHSLNTRGINVVLLDYRNGIYEHRSSYDVLGSNGVKTNFANFLNGLTTGKILFMAAKDAVIFDTSSAQALQRYGVSATFATTNLPKDRCSMAAIAYTDGERKEWEQSINKVGGTGISIIEKTIYLFRDLDGKNDCSQEMGLQTRRMPNSAFTAKSTWDAFHAPNLARLHDQSHPGWCSGANTPVSDYMQIDLGSVKILTGLAIQGHGRHYGHYYITKFKIEYSTDGLIWHSCKDIGSSNTTVFDGIRRLEVIETRVNWFHRTMIRYFKIIPSARPTPSTATTCLRLELYGCTPQVPIFQHDVTTNTTFDILEVNTNSLTGHYTVPSKSKAMIQISTAADNQAIDNNIGQIHFKKVNASITHDNGTIQPNQGIVTITKNQLTKIDSFASIDFNIEWPNYYSFDIDYNYQVMDAGRPNGSIWRVITFQTNEATTLYSIPQRFTRRQPDRSILQFNVTTLHQQQFIDGGSIQLNISFSHVLSQTDGSHSNAYDIDIFVYYDIGFIQFQSIIFVEKDPFSLAPSIDITHNGLIHLHTDELWLFNNQHFSVHMKLKNPNKILKGDNCKGMLLLDIKYLTNLQKFHGTINSTLGRNMEYQCKIDQWKDTSLTSVRIDLAQLSMVYDDVNGDFVFCFQRVSFATRNGPFCYRQTDENDEWYGLSQIGAVVGIHTASRILYGIHSKGKAYLQSSNPYDKFYHIEFSEWKSNESNSAIRKSITVNDISTLSWNPSVQHTISVSGVQLWAATRSGIWKRKGGVLTRVIAF